MDFIEHVLGIKRGEPIPIDAAQWANPDFKPDSPTSTNCGNCVTAYELRRRGYNVVAQPARGGIRLANLNMFNKNGKRPKFCNVSTRKELEQAITSQSDGSRYLIFADFGSRYMAHVFIAENQNSNVRFINPQNPLEYTSIYFAPPVKLAYFRIDGMRFRLSSKQLRKIVRRAKKCEHVIYLKEK